MHMRSLKARPGGLAICVTRAALARLRLVVLVAIMITLAFQRVLNLCSREPSRQHMTPRLVFESLLFCFVRILFSFPLPRLLSFPLFPKALSALFIFDLFYLELEFSIVFNPLLLILKLFLFEPVTLHGIVYGIFLPFLRELELRLDEL